MTNKFTEESRQTFIAALLEGRCVAEAARAAGWARQSAYRYKELDPEFGAEWNRAVEEGRERLARRIEETMLDRFQHGYLVPIYAKPSEWQPDFDPNDSVEERHRKAITGKNVVGYQWRAPEPALQIAVAKAHNDKYREPKEPVEQLERRRQIDAIFLELVGGYVKQQRLKGRQVTEEQAVEELFAMMAEAEAEKVN